MNRSLLLSLYLATHVIANDNIYILPIGKYDHEFGESNWSPPEVLVARIDSAIYNYVLNLDTTYNVGEKNKISEPEFRYRDELFKSNLKFIKKNFLDYDRQYHGYIYARKDSSRKRILNISASFKTNERDERINRQIIKKGGKRIKTCDLEKQICSAYGGGAMYWQIKYDVEIDKILKFYINALE